METYKNEHVVYHKDGSSVSFSRGLGGWNSAFRYEGEVWHKEHPTGSKLVGLAIILLAPAIIIVNGIQLLVFAAIALPILALGKIFGLKPNND